VIFRPDEFVERIAAYLGRQQLGRQRLAGGRRAISHRVDALIPGQFVEQIDDLLFRTRRQLLQQ
jgi:hypothetical protein